MSCHDASYHTISYIIILYTICSIRSLIPLRCSSCVPPINVSRTSTQKYEKVWVPLTNKGSIFVHILVLRNRNYVSRYIRIASTKSLSFSIITFSVLLTNSRVFLPQSHDYSCYASRRIPSVHVQLILLHQAAHIRKNHHPNFRKHKAAVLTGIICDSTA
jgi:hypothetical protein